jgi:hypothetical protein
LEFGLSTMHFNEKKPIIFTNKDVFKVWLFADLFIGIFAIIYFLFENDFPNLNDLIYKLYIYGLVGLIVSLPSLIILLMVFFFLEITLVHSIKLAFL